LKPGIVLFGVLDPTSAEQVVLLMQSRASVPDASQLTLDPSDPIVSSGESPIVDARVVLYGPTGDSAVAVEDRVRRADRLGSGVYRLWTAGSSSTAPAGAFLRLQTGERYRLHVTTAAFGEADGSTRVPAVDRVVAAASRNVILSRDTVLLPTVTPRGAGFVYSLRAANGTSAEGDQQYRRDLEPRLILPSRQDDWAFAFVRERLRTGSRHVLTVTAADSNYFEYYGSAGDPFADRTQRTNLSGAAGVFGSVLLIFTQPITIMGQ
jgi:hypothetical protein